MDLTAIIIVPTIVYLFYKFLELLIRRRERIMLIEKLDTLPPQVLYAGQNLNAADLFPGKKCAGLRAGLLLVGIGVGLMVAWVLAFTLYPVAASYQQSMGSSGGFYHYRDMFSAIYLAAPACFGGLGLLLSYMIEQRACKQGK